GLHLDGYNEELGLAFEYSSNQYYQIVPFFHLQEQMNLDAQIWRDWKKRALCYREGSNWHKEYALVKDEKFDTLLGPQAIFYPQDDNTASVRQDATELEEENYHLRNEIQIEVDTNRRNEKQIRDLERDYDRCVQEIQTLNGEIERLENASKEEIIELKSEISSLKSRLYQAKKDIQDKENYIS
ncbi:19738_t:CDS:2, partial [Funneliformis geosporum]